MLFYLKKMFGALLTLIKIWNPVSADGISFPVRDFASQYIKLPYTSQDEALRRASSWRRPQKEKVEIPGFRLM